MAPRFMGTPSVESDVVDRLARDLQMDEAHNLLECDIVG